MEVELIIKSLVTEVRELRLEVARLSRELSSDKISGKMMTLNEACDYLHISRTTMHNRLANGELCFAVKRGRSWLFPQDKLRDYASGF